MRTDQRLSVNRLKSAVPSFYVMPYGGHRSTPLVLAALAGVVHDRQSADQQHNCDEDNCQGGLHCDLAPGTTRQVSVFQIEPMVNVGLEILRNNARQAEFSDCLLTSSIFAPPSVQGAAAQSINWSERIMPCRSGLRSVSIGVKPSLRWELQLCLWRWQAARQHQRAKRRRTPHRELTKSFLVRRKSPTSAWRRSMSSTTKIPDHPRSPKN